VEIIDFSIGSHFTEVSSRVAGRRRGFGDEYRMFKGLLV
jgi:hypothetical protein